MIIDFHMHCFPDKVAEKAIPKLAKISALENQTNGTYADTLEKMKLWGVDKGVLLHIATNAHQQTSVNNFAAQVNGEKTLSFGSVHWQAENALEELDRIWELGLRGIKLHPDYQGFNVNDKALYPIYDKIAQMGLICVFHAGFDPVSPQHVYCPPDQARRLHRQFPKLKMVLAHMGGSMRWDEAEQYLMGENIYLDTSFCAGNLPTEQCQKMIRKHGSEKILYGSDCPWMNGAKNIAYINNLDISAADKDNIFYKNAQRLLPGLL